MKVTVAYSSHRLETLPAADAMMREHRAVALEEPSTPGFGDMLEGHLDLDEYVMEMGPAFPKFTTEASRLHQKLHRSGVTLVQVDPFVEELLAIHDFFDEGGKPHQIEAGTRRAVVYAHERAWTEALIHFYRSSRGQVPFDDVVAAVQRFARADAARGRLRDELRISSLVQLAERLEGPLYVEAGYIHRWLGRRLRQELAGRADLGERWLLEPVARRLSGRRQVLGPGDHLTLLYTFRPRKASTRAALLAARSLILIRLEAKDELEPHEEPFPHTVDELLCLRLVEGLSYDDCERLYPALRKQESPAVAQKIVEEYRTRWALRPGSEVVHSVGP